MAQKNEAGASSVYDPLVPATLTAVVTVAVCLRADGKSVRGALPMRKVPMLGRPARDDADELDDDELILIEDGAEVPALADVELVEGNLELGTPAALSEDAESDARDVLTSTAVTTGDETNLSVAASMDDGAAETDGVGIEGGIEHG
jgi:hypothetical protein